MDLDRYISDLLLEHNCVIVPHFGGFVGNYIPAKIDRLKNKFQPPSKEISFNQNLIKGDGLLVNQVALGLNISYQRAEIITLDEVDLLKKKLNLEKSIQLKNIGRLFYDKLGNLHFEPSFDLNYSLESYGLSSFHVAPIVKEFKVEKEAVEVIKVAEIEPPKEAKVIPINVPEKERNETWKRVAIAAAILPFMLYVGWLAFSTELFKGSNFAYADLNPFAEKICPTYNVRLVVPLYKVEKLETMFDKQIKGNIISFSVFDKSDDLYDADKLIWAYLTESAVTKVVNTSVAKPVIKKGLYKFHIIAGCFGVYRNADRLAAKLRKRGYNSAIIDQNKGLYRVAFQSYTTETEAELALKEIKVSQNKKAWLLEK